MKKYRLDLHIHSVLSPCADILMTPKNIINKAESRGIDIISITDHNSYANVKSAIEIAKEKDIYILFGIEVQSREEIHILSYFNDFSDLKNYGDLIYNGLENIKNDEDMFGPQILVDEDDRFIAKEKKLLLSSTDYSIEELIELTSQNNGVSVFSHLDRSFGIIKNLGFIPSDLEISFLEMSSHSFLKQYHQKYPELQKYKLLKNSDSHYLKQIKPSMEIYLDQPPTLDKIFSYFKNHRNDKFLL